MTTPTDAVILAALDYTPDCSWCRAACRKTGCPHPANVAAKFAPCPKGCILQVQLFCHEHMRQVACIAASANRKFQCPFCAMDTPLVGWEPM